MVKIEIVEGDALHFPCDVLALKFAQSLYGVDFAVYKHLSDSGRRPPRLPEIDDWTLEITDSRLGAHAVLFLGVVPLHNLDYHQIREFGRKVLACLAVEAPAARHVALTIHGPGYGLDEVEAFRAELAGLIEAISWNRYPAALARVSFVERDPNRAYRLKTALSLLVPTDGLATDTVNPLAALADGQRELLRTVGYDSAAKPYVFVAMPFDGAMTDLFHYGIEGAVHRAGLLCERADLSAFSGDVVEWVKQRISRATLVIADLSTANPNVYLEVGYAWGCSRQTILTVRDEAELKFNVKGQRVLVYKSIRHLEEILAQELISLRDQSAFPA